MFRPRGGYNIKAGSTLQPDDTDIKKRSERVSRSPFDSFAVVLIEVMNDTTDYIGLLDKFHQGTATPEEIRQLTRWFDDEELSRRDVSKFYHGRWDEASSRIDESTQERMLDNIHSRIIRRTDSNRHRRRKIANIILSAVSAACILLAVGTLVAVSHRGTTEARITITTENGQKSSVVLPDGTSVWLNSATQLSYNTASDGALREVWLSGEGYFEVAKDPKRRFLVHTDGYCVEALGTAFNVRSYRDENTSIATLIEGKVAINGQNYSTVLVPDESIVFTPASGTFYKQRSDRACFAGTWRNNELVIAPNTTLYQLCAILEREYNIEFIVSDSQIGNLTYEGIIKNNGLQSVLDLITLSSPVKYTIRGNQVVVEPATGRKP